MFKKSTLLLCSIICVILSGCTPKNPVTMRQQFAFDTIISIQLYNVPNAEELLDECMELCTHYENLFSRTKEGSDIYRINHSGGATTTVHPETAQLLQTALTYCRLSEGAFDITLAPLSDLWNFQAAQPRIPSDKEIQDLLIHTGYENIQVKDQQVQLLDSQTQIDIGGIAKGYVADQLKLFLQSQNVTHALIDLGGNILTLGGKPDGSPFHIGIQKPFDQQGSSITSVQTMDGAVVSSGNYQRYFEQNGIIYHHILDPKTGYPSDSKLNGVTIISQSSVEADALSTTCYVLGVEKGTKLIQSLPHTEAIFITNDNQLISTEQSGQVRFELPSYRIKLTK